MASANLVLLTGKILELRDDGSIVLNQDVHERQQKDVINTYLVRPFLKQESIRAPHQVGDLIAVEGKLKNVVKEMPIGKPYTFTEIHAYKIDNA